MNDSKSSANAKRTERHGEDVDTCRICRGEGSQEEPLFYPCKCSGSIKFVHQSCLMEWLAHSQKKHCELCKTPFRFTKLYHPHMPSTVPIPVFLRRAAVHGWATFQTWIRLQLVFFVWVFWLPWCMRAIWRGLFWVGDGAWVDWSEHEGYKSLETLTNKTELPGNGRTPDDVHLFDSKQAAAAAFMKYLGTKGTQMLNSNPWRKEPITFSLAKRLYRFFSGEFSAGDISLESGRNTTDIVRGAPRSPTWLSDLRFLRTMTRSTTINNVITDTLEGQLITLFVVVAFILIFLIREWVMQQQQNMLLGPGGDNEEAAGPNLDAPAQQQLDQGVPEQDLAGAGPADNGPRPRLFVRPRRRLNRPLPLVVGQHRADPLAQPVEGNAARDEPATYGADPPGSPIARTPGASTPSQLLLPPKRNKNGEVVDPPIELEDLLRESRIFRDILQRVLDDPTLKIMTIIKREIPAYEVNLLQRLNAPGVQPYLKALHSTPPATPARAVHDEEKEVLNRKAGKVDGMTDANLKLEFLDVSSPESKQNALPQETFVDPSRVFDDAKEHVTTREPSDDKQDVQDPVPGDDFNPAGNLSTSELAIRPVLPYNGRSGLSPSWTFDDAVDDCSDVQYTPQESLDEAFQPDKLDGDDVLIDESQIMERLNSDNPASSGMEISGPGMTPSRPETEDASEEAANHQVEEAVRDRGYVEAVKNWLWGDIAFPAEAAQQQAGDDERVVDDFADEAPFVPVGHGQNLLHPAEEGENPAQDPEVVAAAAQAGIDPNEAEAVDEVEDLEGIMELVGMEGPLAGLMQNGMFCAVLVSLTIFFGVWIPYMCGKVFLILIANPVTLSLGSLRLASTGADMVVDLIVLLFGGGLYWTGVIISLPCQPISWVLPALKPYFDIVAQALASYAEHAFDRIVRVSLLAGESLNKGIDVPTFSVVAHESLRQLESQLTASANLVFDFQAALTESLLRCPSTSEVLKILSSSLITKARALVIYIVQKGLVLKNAAPLLLHINPLKFKVSGSHRSTPLDFDLAAWDATDSAVAVIAGYTFFGLLGVLYLHVAGVLRGTNEKGAVNGSLAQVLYQAGGVMKVILIISIEMIAFPLYCGLLLDIALLPLFGNVTLLSRVEFTATSPWTSVFVHWFVGTCYMFHFALFVSMCRRIMRTGVLYFIRDPDDPTFHPVRDVLERSVSSQLWKISFSALVYGGLVLFCLGGVVWGIAYVLPGVFPIHWSSDEPVLEFPVDLLFYNFLMPMAVKSFKPSVGLNKVYGWWFRKCARALRLSSFLFNDTRSDEEGRHVRRNWSDVLYGVQGDIRKPVIGEDRQVLAEDRGVRAIFLRDGRYVRTPGSDQVRIPKGATTFIEVDENDERLDSLKDGDEDPYGRKMSLFTKVYIPPFFRMRVAAFICLIWLFAAFTGVSVTLLPLLFGRWVFARLTPNHLRMNDIYAFSIGIYILGSAFWALLNHRRIRDKMYALISPHAANTVSAVHQMKAVTVRVLSLVYAYSALGILLPCLFSLLLEFYIIIPLHTYILNKDNTTTSENPVSEVLARAPLPVIYLIQDWTLGVLIVKMFACLILWTAPSRPALALRAVVARGWLDPDIRLATRAFILPATLMMAVTLCMPLMLGWAANSTFLYSYTKDNEYFRACVYRYSYPAVLVFGLAIVILWLAGTAFEGWRRKIRDEVYLIGERLHNFGEGARTGAMSRVRVGKLAVGRAQ